MKNAPSQDAHKLRYAVGKLIRGWLGTQTARSLEGDSQKSCFYGLFYSIALQIVVREVCVPAFRCAYSGDGVLSFAVSSCELYHRWRRSDIFIGDALLGPLGCPSQEHRYAVQDSFRMISLSRDDSGKRKRFWASRRPLGRYRGT